MKIDSKTFYREMRDRLAPLLRANGFAKLAGTQLGWSRPSGEQHVLLWFQCDKWGWDAQWGSKFTLEFQQVAQLAQVFSAAGRRERIGFVLEGYDELDAIRLMNNAVIERLPGTHARALLAGLGGLSREQSLIGEHVDPDTAVYARDVWLNYYSLDDVRAWAGWFEQHLLRLVDLFEHERLSEQARARLRFHEMMGRVQANLDRAAKIAILSEHVANESDAHYRDAAAYWLGEAQQRAG